MTFNILLQMMAAAFLAVVIYTFIGFIPGTDETSVLMPITLTVILAGIPPIVALTFFIAAIVTLNLINAIPTALVGLPGGVMSSPMMEHSLYLKEKGKSAIVIKKMAVGSLIGVLCSVPISLTLANILAPYGENIKEYAPLLFMVGAIFLSLTSKNKILSLISIIPMSILFMGLRHLYWGIGIVPKEVNITTSFFLGITIGPLIVSLFSLLNKNERKTMLTDKEKEIVIPKDEEAVRTLNPFKILSRDEMKKATFASIIVNFLFVLSPVGLTILIGEAMGNKVKDSVERASTTITTMSALAQSTYISGIVIPLIALGMPLSPTSIGPGSALFNAPPVFTVDNNLHHLLSRKEFVLAILLGGGIAVTITYIITNRYAGRISNFVLRKIPHEAILGLFISFILLLSFMDAGLLNVFGVLLIGLTCGTLNKLGVNYGVQFMTLYAAPWLIEKIILL